MAKTQVFYAQRKKSESGQTGEVVYDLPENGFIPEIDLVVYSTPTASVNPAPNLEAVLTKVEVLDGAKVIKSYRGNQVRALSQYHKLKNLALTDTDKNSTEGYGVFKILLGKTLNGVHYAPDMSQFSNPQIKIAWDYSITSWKGAACDADTSPSMKFTVACHKITETSAYRHGYVKTASVETYTQAASTETRVKIPTNVQLVGLGIDAGYDGLQFTDDVNKVKLDIDSGSWVPLELYEEEIIPMQQRWFGAPFTVSYTKDIINNKEIDSRMGYVTGVNGAAATAVAREFAWAETHTGIGTTAYYDAGTPTAISTYEQAYLRFEGYVPNGVYYIPAWALQNGEGDVLDLTKYKSVDLYITSSASASTSSKPQVIMETLETK